MPLTYKDRIKGGLAVARKKGRKYMSLIGKNGRKKQLENKKIKKEGDTAV